MANQTQSLAKRRSTARNLSSAIAPIERRYVDALTSLARAVAGEYMRALEPYVRARADSSMAHTLTSLGIHVQVATEQTVGKVFDRHAKDVSGANGKALRVMGIRPPTDAGVREELANRRKENIDLVVNAQRAYAQSVVDVFNAPENEGLAVDELKAKLLARGDVSESRAELIARDQTLKLNGSLTEIRQTNAGVTSYTWSTSNDERVREEHAVLEGQVFSWDAAPAVGHPGEDFQCRCVALPVIDELKGLDDPPGVKAAEEVAQKAPQLEEGKHIAKVTSQAAPEVRISLLESISDAETLAILEQTPLERLEIKKRVGKDSNGRYMPFTRTLALTVNRQERSFGQDFVPGKSWSISSVTKTKEEAIVATFRHELGHHVHMFDGPASATDTIVEQAFLRAKTPITKYAAQDRHEYFAESYAAYHLRKEALEAHDPIGFKMVEDVLRVRKAKLGA